MGSTDSAAAAFDKQTVYRVFRLGRFLELLTQKKNTLVRPRLWEDPWEEWWAGLIRKRLGASIPNDVFGQCWTTSKESDAMWRVYAPHLDGVKARTTVASLRDSVSDAGMRYRATVSKVMYRSKASLTKWGIGVLGHLEKTKPRRRDLVDVRKAIRVAQLEWFFVKPKSSREWGKFVKSAEANEFLRAIDAVDPYRHKRLEFRWEQEVRLLAWRPDQLDSDTLSYPYDPARHIDEVVLDPRMQDAVCAMAVERIRSLGLNCRIQRSRLYSLDL